MIRFDPRDWWIGVYWNRFQDVVGDPKWTYEAYICLIPCFPLRLTWRK